MSHFSNLTWLVQLSLFSLWGVLSENIIMQPQPEEPELCWELRKYFYTGQAFSPSIFVSDSDFVAMTKNGALCNEHGHLGPIEFETVMREQVNV